MFSLKSDALVVFVYSNRRQILNIGTRKESSQKHECIPLATEGKMLWFTRGNTAMMVRL